MVVLVLCLSMAFPISANDFLFTSIDTSHGLSDNQIRYILQLPGMDAGLVAGGPWKYVTVV